MCELWQRHGERVVLVAGSVLDAVVDQCHQRGELVRRHAAAGLQDGHDALAQRERIGGPRECHGCQYGTTAFRRRRMGKLVRDRIPEIIRSEGGSARTRALGDEAYRAALLDKLLEEA